MWVLDIEANGLYDDATQLWCMVFRNVQTDEVVVRTCEDSFEEFPQMEVLIGHNIIGYDLPVLKKLISWSVSSGVKVVDTFLLSQILSPERDSHSLESYQPDAKVGNETWDHFHPVMLERCISDTEITRDIFLDQVKILKSWGFDIDAGFIDLESEIMADVTQQGIDGCPINEEMLLQYIEFLEGSVESMGSVVQGILGSYITDTHTYKEPFTIAGGLRHYVSNWVEASGVDPDAISGPFTRFERVNVKLTQHERVKKVLLGLGWVPSSYTDKGSPKLPKGTEWDDIAETTGSTELSEIAQYGGYKNRLDILLGWKDKLRDSTLGDFKVISHGAFTCGTPTARFRHQAIVNIPRPSSLFGQEMRSLIYCPYEDYVQVGWDLSGIELRMLAHFMNDAEFIALVADPEGDIHTFFWEKVTKLVASRDDWKNVFYGYSYGAGDGKLGSLCTSLAVADRTPASGKILRDTIETSTPSLGRLVSGVQKASLRGYLIGLDGRRISMKTGRNKRKVKIGGAWLANPQGVITKDALNRLLQSGAAIVFKRAVSIILSKIENLRVRTLIYYHDEGQNFVHKEDVDMFKTIVEESVTEAGEYYNLRIPLACDIKIGSDWSECH